MTTGQFPKTRMTAEEVARQRPVPLGRTHGPRPERGKSDIPGYVLLGIHDADETWEQLARALDKIKAQSKVLVELVEAHGKAMWLLGNAIAYADPERGHLAMSDQGAAEYQADLLADVFDPEEMPLPGEHDLA